MKHIETSILIHADAATVWNALTDFERYDGWNPFILSAHGEKEAGSRLSITARPPGGNAMTFKPVVLKCEPHREFRWKGSLGIPGIFDGEHYFRLEPSGDNQTTFIHGEYFSGVLVWFMGAVLEKTKTGFELMNAALKQECESSA